MSKNNLNDKIITNAMSVDVEDYFQVSAFEDHIDRGQWDQLECRVEQNTNRILDVFAERSISATFFVLGWVAERYPQLVKRIINDGHEIACHGFDHVRVTKLTQDQFRQDVSKTKKLLEDIGGEEIKGYRAPSYSIGAKNLWALEVLEDEGYRYSSSIYPIRHDLYGMPNAPRFPFKPNNSEFIEIPVSTTQIGKMNVPCGGGGYFRLLPYYWSKWAINRVNSKEGQSTMFYFHPWEIDDKQPRQKGISLKTQVRHYTNLSRMEKKLEYLLRDFKWDRIDRVFIT